MKLTNKKGVTLLELIVVFIIIGIGAALLTPNIGAWLPNYRLRSAARDVVSMMRLAQMKAVSNNLQYRVNLDNDEIGANSYILQYNTGGNWVDEGEKQGLPRGIIIDPGKITFSGKHAEFNPNSTSSSGSVTLSVTLRNSTKREKTITLISATGRVKLE